ncbi:MAG TPA: hypothetical protein DEB39_00930 [Planctomycetaceae bacterium]|nr:hypothetical protein [Planctomycetaceae bacterium]
MKNNQGLLRCLCFTLVAFCTATAFTGCGDCKVTGVVTFADGTPLETGTVCFENEKANFVGYGMIGKGGRYNLGKTKDGDGIPSGDYSVYVQGAAEIVGRDAGGSAIYKSLVADKFASPVLSEIKCTVNGKTAFDFQVARPKNSK